MSRIVDLVEHDLWGISYPDGSGSPGLVHRVIREEICRPAHCNGGHEADLIRARPVDVIEVGVVDLVPHRGARASMGLERRPIGVEELASVDQASHAVVYPANVPVLLVFSRYAKGALRSAGVKQRGIPDLRLITVIELERSGEEVDPLDLDIVIVVADQSICLGLDTDIQFVRIVIPTGHVVKSPFF